MTSVSGVAHLLVLLGRHASRGFADRLGELGLTPAHVRVLGLVGREPGLHQREVAERLGAAPSRLVTLVDDLEERSLLERRRSATDRRHQQLHVAGGAGPQLAAVRRVVGAHDADLVAGLEDHEVATLRSLLAKVAAARGLPVEPPEGQVPPSP